MEDNRIIDLFFERSEQAISELAQKYGGMCRKVSQNILKNKSDAEECVNDAFLGVWNSIPPQRPDPLLTYICRIVRNLSITRYHANTASKRNSKYSVSLDELGDCLPNTVNTLYDERELPKIIDGFLGTLDKDSRVLFVRRYWFSDSMAEIAAIFCITEHNASVRLSRLRVRLKKHLEREGVSI